jgi:two-component system, NarL family, nitrate/nitrite response regulator NarL
MDKIRILLIEDNRLLREGIAALLEKEQDFEVIAKAEDGDAIEKLKNAQKSPHIILLDLGLQKTNSLLLMKKVHKEFPEIKVIAMDIIPSQVDVVEFIEAGGDGMLLKNASIDDFSDTIRKVVQGEKILPSVLTNSLFIQIIENSTLTSEDIQESINLTRREREIVSLISEGLSNKEIAQQLNIATFTVKSHVHNILEKLDLRTRLEVAVFAQKKQA